MALYSATERPLSVTAFETACAPSVKRRLFSSSVAPAILCSYPLLTEKTLLTAAATASSFASGILESVVLGVCIEGPPEGGDRSCALAAAVKESKPTKQATATNDNLI